MGFMFYVWIIVMVLAVIIEIATTDLTSVWFAIGAAFALEANTTSTPITGNNGVYMISVGEKTVAEGQLNAAQEISNLNMRTSYTIPYQVVSLIEEKADIIDNRARFQ